MTLVDPPKEQPAMPATTEPHVRLARVHSTAHYVSPVHHRFAYRRLASSSVPLTTRILPAYASAGPGFSSGGGANNTALPADHSIVSDTVARAAQPVNPQLAQIPQPVAADTPVVTTTSPAAVTTVAPPAPTPTTGVIGASVASDTNGGGDGTGIVANTVAGTGNGNGSGTGNGNGDNSGAGSGSGSGGPFGIGSGGDDISGGPRHIVYCLDCSPSMTTRIDRARSELASALTALQPGETFDIICFSASDTTLFLQMTAATSYEVGQARWFLQNTPLSPGTNIERVMKHALSFPDVNEVVLITDGVPTVGEQNFTKLADDIEESNINHAQISTVGLVGKNPDGSDDSFQASSLLQKIAQDSGGTSKVVTCGVATPDD